jgi:hypothetical protein
VTWLRDVLLNSVFTKERLEVLIAKELQNLPSQKRDGDQVAREWCNRLCFDLDKSTSEAASLLHQLEFIPRISEELKQSPEKVIKAMETLIQKVVDPSVMRVNVYGDIKSLSEPRSTLAKAFIPIKEAVDLEPLTTSAATLTELGKAPSKKVSSIGPSKVSMLTSDCRCSHGRDRGFVLVACGQGPARLGPPGCSCAQRRTVRPQRHGVVPLEVDSRRWSRVWCPCHDRPGVGLRRLPRVPLPERDDRVQGGGQDHAHDR